MLRGAGGHRDRSRGLPGQLQEVVHVLHHRSGMGHGRREFPLQEPRHAKRQQCRVGEPALEACRKKRRIDAGVEREPRRLGENGERAAADQLMHSLAVWPAPTDPIWVGR